MTTLKELGVAIKVFTTPYRVSQNTSDPFKTRGEWNCRDKMCSISGKGEKPPTKHSAQCAFSLLQKHGATKKLANLLGKRASYLDYEGGGRYACPICFGMTERGSESPRHKKNCPGVIAHKLMDPRCSVGS